MNKLLESHSGLRSDAGFRRKDYNSLPPSYSFTLKSFPALYYGKEDLESGNKVLLPSNILNKLSTYQLPQPLIFSIQNTITGNSTNVGVLEFTSESDEVILPNWLFMQLGLDLGVEVNLQPLLKVQKGEFMKLQPHETEFIKLPDPKAILEKNLLNYVCVTQGDTLIIQTINKTYLINILDVKPKLQSNCICLIDADVEVEFAPPLDYKEKVPGLIEPLNEIYSNKEENKDEGPFSGKGIKINGQNVINEIKEEGKVDFNAYDPRKHRLINGIRSSGFEHLGEKIKNNNQGPILGRTGPRKTPS